MVLTLKQEQGLKECIERYKNGEKYCVISGSLCLLYRQGRTGSS